MPSSKKKLLKKPTTTFFFKSFYFATNEKIRTFQKQPTSTPLKLKKQKNQYNAEINKKKSKKIQLK